jgi:hypothetical protein
MANVPDAKKCQTYINALADAAIEARSAVDRMRAARVKFQAVNPSTSGTPLSGNVAIVSGAISTLGNETDRAIWTAVIAAKIATHGGGGLD